MKKIDILDEVYSEKQRRWACWQMNAPKSEREISKSKATEMCKDVKHSKKKKEESVNPKMKKKDLVEYINKKLSIKENTEDVFYVSEIPSPEKREIFKYFKNLRDSGVINMFGSHVILNWTKEDLHRWLYGMSKDIESIESEIEDLEYDNEEGENDSEIESLESQKENINYLLENKNKVRDILIRAAITRIENSNGELELTIVQRVFEKISQECFKMWVSLLNQRN
jgi:hypothetical protein